MYAGKLPLLLSVALIAASCNGADKDDVGDTDLPVAVDCADSALTWTNFGQGFIHNWCTGCHSADVTGDRRQGAPVGVDFDTYAQVLQWAPRIDARVGSEGVGPGIGPMPPADGIPTEEEDDLHEWIACGLPGATTPEVEVCDGPRAPYAGDVTVTAAGPDVAAFCESYNAIDGSLTVAVGSATALSACLCDVTGDLTFAPGAGDTTELAELRAVGGDLAVTGTATLAAVRLLRLESVGGAVTVDGNLGLVDLYLEELESVGGPVTVTSNPELVAIGLGKVEAVPTGDLTVTGNDAALYLEVYRLVTVAGDLLVADNAAMFNLVGTDELASIGGDVRIADLPALTQLSNFEYITSVGGDIEFAGLGASSAPIQLLGWAALLDHRGSIRITGNPGFEEIKAFPNLVDLGGELVVSDNPLLEELDDGFLRLEVVGSEADPDASAVTIARNPLLVDYSGLFSLEVVGSLVLEDNDSLLSAAGFGVLRTVFGDLRIVDNDDVGSLLGYLALDVIGGDLVVEGNAKMAAIDGFTGLASVGGEIRVAADPGLVAIQGFDDLTIAGGFVLADLPKATTIELPAVATLTGDLRVLGADALVTAPALPALSTVDGTVEVSGNAALTDLSPWLGIDAIGGDLLVTSNPALPTAEAEALAEAATVGGTTIISGNAP